MKVLVFNRQKDLRLSPLSAKSVAKDVLVAEEIETDEITICFVSSSEICRIHADFFRDPSPTDCISFPIDGLNPIDDGYHILGEILVCPQTAIDYLSTHTQEEANDPYQETTLYLVHGLLHLLGYDDIDEKDRMIMREAENMHMNRLLSKNILLKEPFPL